MEKEKKKILLEISPEEYGQIERRSIYNNSNIEDYIINKTLDRNLRDIEIEKRTEIVKTRITPSELKYLEKKIEDTNYTMSDLIRSAVLDKEIIVVDGIDNLAKQLKAIGKNLNQLTMLSNKGIIKDPNLDEIENKINEMWSKLNIIMTKKTR